MRRSMGVLVLVSVMGILALAVSTSHASHDSEVDGYYVAWAQAAGDQTGGPIRVEVFSTLADAAFVATGGVIRLPPDATGDDLVRELERIEPDIGTLKASEITIGLDYDLPNFGTPRLLWTVSNDVGCSTGLTYVADMPAGWIDRVSSALGFGGCGSFIHYSDFGQAGMSISCDCATMGTMDNRTRSVRWEP